MPLAVALRRSPQALTQTGARVPPAPALALVAEFAAAGLEAEP